MAAKPGVKEPRVVLTLGEDGLKVELENWRHAVPIRYLDNVEASIYMAIHRWRAAYVAAEKTMGQPTNRDFDNAALLNERK